MVEKNPGHWVEPFLKETWRSVGIAVHGFLEFIRTSIGFPQKSKEGKK